MVDDIDGEFCTKIDLCTVCHHRIYTPQYEKLSHHFSSLISSPLDWISLSRLPPTNHIIQSPSNQSKPMRRMRRASHGFSEPLCQSSINLHLDIPNGYRPRWISTGSYAQAEANSKRKPQRMAPWVVGSRAERSALGYWYRLMTVDGDGNRVSLCVSSLFLKRPLIQSQ